MMIPAKDKVNKHIFPFYLGSWLLLIKKILLNQIKQGQTWHRPMANWTLNTPIADKKKKKKKLSYRQICSCLLSLLTLADVFVLVC